MYTPLSSVGDMHAAARDECGRSHDDSDADGPLMLGVDGNGMLMAGADGTAAPGVALGLAGGAGAGSRRHGHHHRGGPSGKAKASKSKTQNAAVMRTWVKVERGGETSILQARPRRRQGGRGGHRGVGCGAAWPGLHTLLLA